MSFNEIPMFLYIRSSSYHHTGPHQSSRYSSSDSSTSSSSDSSTSSSGLSTASSSISSTSSSSISSTSSSFSSSLLSGGNNTFFARFFGGWRFLFLLSDSLFIRSLASFLTF